MMINDMKRRTKGIKIKEKKNFDGLQNTSLILCKILLIS
jgi:hypothetical protein